jgi:molybdopterin-guanine dinucleotide biosynthesis protein A
MVSYSNSSLISLSAIILAGGKSSRMGEDKALLKVDGVPLLQKITTVAADCTASVYVVAPWIDRYTSILPPSCQLLQEELPTQGPLVAFCQALSFVETEWILLLACDLPLLTSSAIREWMQSLPSVSETAIAYLPKCDRLWQPLSGFYRRSCLAPLENFIHRGGRSFQTWLNQSTVQELSVSDPSILLNCNTPEDLQSITKISENRR